MGKEIFLQHINSIEIINDKIFVGSFPDGLLVYNKVGQLISKIGRRGFGPGEYKYGDDFALNTIGEFLYINDRTKIVKYDSNGNFVYEFPLTQFGTKFNDIKYKAGLLYLAEGISMGYAKYDWVIIDTLGTLINEKLNYIPTFYTKWGGSGKFMQNREKIYYYNDFNDTIFSLTTEDNMFFDKGTFRLPVNDIERFGDYLNIYSILLTSRYLYLWYYYNGFDYSGIIDIKKNEYTITSKNNDKDRCQFYGPGIPNDIDGGLNFQAFNHFVSMEDEYLVGWFFPYELKAHVTSDAFKNFTPKYPEKKRELEQLANSLSENDNPVLMIVKLKE